MPVLVVEKGPDSGASIQFTAPKITIGRSSAASLTLHKNSVSRQHFQIYVDDGKYYLTDMGSMNGTVINGHLLADNARALLKDGDIISIGDISLLWVQESQEQPDDPLTRQNVDGYLICQRLGKGGMGSVYLAQQISLKRSVAIKILNTRLAADKNFIERFIEEARACAKLNHMNILQVYDVGEWQGHHYFSMEYAAGGSIQTIIDGQRRLPPEQAVAYMLDTARGLEYAERKGIVHCDIKPANLMLSEDKIVKIGDLGLARRTEKKHAQQGQIYGTSHFVAPEQARGEAIDHRADMYAFGASFYRILAGRTPFTGSNMREILASNLKDKAPPLKSLVPSLPDELCHMIATMMQKKPEQRYVSHSAIIDELEQIQRKLQRRREQLNITRALPKLRRSAEGMPTVRKKQRKFKKYRNFRRPSSWLPYTIVIVCLLLLLLWILTSSSRLRIKLSQSLPTNKAKPQQDAGKKTTDKVIPPKSQVKSAVHYAHLYSQYSNKLAEIDRLLAAEEFYQALVALDILRREWGANGQQSLAIKQKQVEEAILRKIPHVEQQLRVQRQNRQYAANKNIIGKWQAIQAIATPVIHGELQRKIPAWQAFTIENCDQVESQAQKQHHRDQQVVRHYRKCLRKHLQNYQFAAAARELTTYIEKLHAKTQRKKLTQLIAEIQHIENLFCQIAMRMQGGKYATKLLPSFYLDNLTKHGTPKLYSIKDGQLIFRIYISKRNYINQKLPLNKLSAKWIYENLMYKGTAPSPQMWHNIALFCYHYRLYRQGATCSSKAKATTQELRKRFSQIETHAREEYITMLLPQYQLLKSLSAQLEQLNTQGKQNLYADLLKFQKSLQAYQVKYRHTRFVHKNNANF